MKKNNEKILLKTAEYACMALAFAGKAIEVVSKSVSVAMNDLANQAKAKQENNKESENEPE